MEQPTEFVPTDVRTWKKTSVKKHNELVLPSGHTCLATKVNMHVFLKTGRIPNSLRPILQEAMDGKEIEQEEIMSKIMSGDGEATQTFFELMQLVDLVVVDCMVEPKVIPAPKSEDLRSETELHVDEMEDEDKMFIFSFATGGTRDLESFREKSARNVELVLSQSGGESFS